MIVGEELLEHHLKVSTSEDQEVVEQLTANGADPAFRVGIRSRAPEGQANGLDAFTDED